MSAATTGLICVVDERLRCLGFLLNRRGKFEAFDIDERSIGTFADEAEAVAAITMEARDAR